MQGKHLLDIRSPIGVTPTIFALLCDSTLIESNIQSGKTKTPFSPLSSKARRENLKMLESSLLNSITDPVLLKQPSSWTIWVRRYWRTNKCIGSWAVATVLLASFSVALVLFELLLNSDNYYFRSRIIERGSYNNSVVFVILLDLIGIFYPIAGYLADNKFGRYKTVRFSLAFLLVPSALLGATYVIVTFLLPALEVSFIDRDFVITYWCLAGLLYAAVCIGIVGFFANIIQFGMDQIYEYPAEVQSLFILWFWWTNFAAELVSQLSWFMSRLPCNEDDSDLRKSSCLLSFLGSVLTGIVYACLVVLILSSCCVVSWKKSWFLIEPSSINPYKLVLKVTNFACKYRKPLRRSAFTYCEDDVPTGLDIAKGKYGGSFSVEQVEDVKAFYGIFLVLLSLGPAFSLRVGADGSLYQFAQHSSILNYSLDSNTWNVTSFNNDIAKMLLVNYGALTPLLMTLLVPFHVFFIRPLFYNYIPGMLKRIGIGIFLSIVSVACTGIEHAISNKDYSSAGCFFDGNPVSLNLTGNDTLIKPLYDTNILIVQRTLSALSIMFITIAMYEFICSQSPHSMKGLLIGLSYAIKAFFQTLSSALMLPLTQSSLTWCGEIWYFLHFAIGIGALVLYGLVARRYKFRMRNDPCHIYKFAEEYYSKVQ